MITVKQHEKLIDKIKRLSELELDELLRDVAEHLRKNNIEHLMSDSFYLKDDAEEMDRLQGRIEELEDNIEELESAKQNLELKIENAIESLDELMETEFGEDWGRDKIEETITALK